MLSPYRGVHPIYWVKVGPGRISRLLVFIKVHLKVAFVDLRRRSLTVEWCVFTILGCQARCVRSRLLETYIDKNALIPPFVQFKASCLSGWMKISSPTCETKSKTDAFPNIFSMDISNRKFHFFRQFSSFLSQWLTFQPRKIRYRCIFKGLS